MLAKIVNCHTVMVSRHESPLSLRFCNQNPTATRSAPEAPKSGAVCGQQAPADSSFQFQTEDEKPWWHGAVVKVCLEDGANIGRRAQRQWRPRGAKREE